VKRYKEKKMFLLYLQLSFKKNYCICNQSFPLTEKQQIRGLAVAMSLIIEIAQDTLF